jgi:hypothetical protein
MLTISYFTFLPLLVFSPTTDDVCVLQDAACLSAAFCTPCRLSHVGHKTNIGIKSLQVVCPASAEKPMRLQGLPARKAFLFSKRKAWNKVKHSDYQYIYFSLMNKLL